ncbi:NUDIX hydrolase [Micromonospora humi]|uniref:ADP-ribose pyrophosphatase YjhB, NUDIX family n=1 Tax=Micromonospora humi TaxID=745366 RepID=A0A1C5H1I5_9ACTN|nr:NUDIX domain-containing protein [Micromonospora humi]SCG39916.1 ADP-ribose pyrophosphatase YjhB, NUDIX family [Micromonospora humi]
MSVIDKVTWLRVENGAILSTRSHGKNVYYLPGGKREDGESDLDTLVREVQEELSVDVDPDSAVFTGVFEAQAHGHADGVMVRMRCYTADYRGTLRPAAEIAELAWLTYADRHRVSPVDQIIFDQLRREAELR